MTDILLSRIFRPERLAAWAGIPFLEWSIAYLRGVPKITAIRVNDDVRDSPLRVGGDKVHRKLTSRCACPVPAHAMDLAGRPRPRNEPRPFRRDFAPRAVRPAIERRA